MPLSRRAFLASGAAAVATAGLRGRHGESGPPPSLKPPRLRGGDRVALINTTRAPASVDEVAEAVRALEGLGLGVVVSRSLRGGRPASASARECADEINELFAARSVRGLVALRGGWGCAAMLPHLDYALIREHPKVVLGFSDVDALLLGIHAMTGLVTFHGPTGIAPWQPRTVAQLRLLLFDGQAPGLSAADGITIVPGQARGRLLGGNLTVVSSLIGSPYVGRDEDLVLFLEEVSEPFSEVDRMFTQLDLAGLLDRAAAVVFGRCPWCGPPALDRSLNLGRVLTEQLAPRGIPVFLGAPIGHVDEQLTVPLGIPAHVDAARRSVRLLEPAVV